MTDGANIGTISVRIDDFTPCLKSTSTGELVDNAEIYALVVKGTVDIQGLVALQRDPDEVPGGGRRRCRPPGFGKVVVKSLAV